MKQPKPNRPTNKSGSRQDLRIKIAERLHKKIKMIAAAEIAVISMKIVEMELIHASFCFEFHGCHPHWRTRGGRRRTIMTVDAIVPPG